eukprot:5822928-Amphidinium_carterae.2
MRWVITAKRCYIRLTDPGRTPITKRVPSTPQPVPFCGGSPDLTFAAFCFVSRFFLDRRQRRAYVLL